MSYKDKDTHSQSKKIMHSVYVFLKKLSKKTDLTADFFKCTQDITAQTCGVSFRTVSRIRSEATHSVNTQALVPSFKSPPKSYKRVKIQTQLDNFDADIV